MQVTADTKMLVIGIVIGVIVGAMASYVLTYTSFNTKLEGCKANVTSLQNQIEELNKKT